MKTTLLHNSPNGSAACKNWEIVEKQTVWSAIDDEQNLFKRSTMGRTKTTTAAAPKALQGTSLLELSFVSLNVKWWKNQVNQI
jgi:hypothetical protein